MRKVIVMLVVLWGIHEGCPYVAADDLHGLHFDGRTYAVVTNAADLKLDDSYTVEAWVKPAAGSGSYTVLDKSIGDQYGSKAVGLNDWRMMTGMQGVWFYYSDQRVLSQQWSHLAWSARNTGGNTREYKQYVNGKLVLVTNYITFADVGSTIELGRAWQRQDYFVGEMVDVRFWNVVRSEREIYDYMMAPPAGNTNLVAHWLYNSGDGTNVYDAAGNHEAHIYGAGTGSNVWVPVSVAPGVMSPAKKGLWVGEALVAKVSRAAPSAASTNNWDNTPQITGQSFPMRLIVHVDSNGGMRVLPEVYLAGATEWVVVTNYNGGSLTNAGSGTVVSNEVWRYGVYSSPENIPQDRQAQVQRISSTAFPVSADPVVMFGETNCYEGNVVVPFDDPINPFVHAYHPDHDNKNAEGSKLGNGVESWTVTRRVSLEYYDANPSMANDPHWGEDRWGGVYRERMEGVYRYPLFVEGAFSLQKISDVGDLD
ncbi:MAG: LamG domain-containing protein [Kiritimatiellae bacterium]|nr:LamG domain-containing protein [Kiritimatiellia bacterium]MDD4736415.1 LamG domain-containing protein [Kiritimatiellia bacterium]